MQIALLCWQNVANSVLLKLRRLCCSGVKTLLIGLFCCCDTASRAADHFLYDSVLNSENSSSSVLQTPPRVRPTPPTSPSRSVTTDTWIPDLSSFLLAHSSRGHDIAIIRVNGPSSCAAMGEVANSTGIGGREPHRWGRALRAIASALPFAASALLASGHGNREGGSQG